MTNKEKIDYLLIDLRELENLIGSMKEVDFYPASFFNQSFQLTHKIFKELHALENQQIETLRQQMEEHQRLIDSLQQNQPVNQPVVEDVIEDRFEEKPEEKQEVPVEPVVTTSPEPVEEEKSVQEPEIPPHMEMAPKTVVAEKTTVSLNDILEKKNLSDFRKAFSLNDRFRFRRELFGGNEEKMNQAITDLNEFSSYEDSVSYLYNVLKWNVEDESVADFLKLLEKRFS